MLTMPICAAWRPKVRASTPFILCRRRSVFTNEQFTSIPLSGWPGAGFRARNAELLTEAADNYEDLRQFDNALKLYDRALEIRPNDQDLLAAKAGIYQAQGNLTEAARCLGDVNALSPSYEAVPAKVTQLIFE